MARILMLSDSRPEHGEYLQHCKEVVRQFLGRFAGCTQAEEAMTLLFIPYAVTDMDTRAELVRDAVSKWGYRLESIHTKPDPVKAVQEAEVIFVGGGNTFKLLNAFYENQLMDVVRQQVLEKSVPYIGWSAGSLLATCGIHTTSDMPIVYPPSFQALSLLPFNVSCHYEDPDPKSRTETRDKKIEQYHDQDGTPPVIGLRNGSFLQTVDGVLTLLGEKTAKLFVRGQQPTEYPAGSDLSFLLAVPRHITSPTLRNGTILSSLGMGELQIGLS